ncbi:NAD-dependent epimerase/dehydratase family protein [Streptomyces gougerotii]|uniref:NAD-dependent epimerase/dehydratase family protein n=1 Tax=Streptomyces gougerotii TaxID=53448 RepID=UPI00280B857F|nr:NAD-dependent epimerase/dehydratase family protein [Streptomyces gougerotii]
MRGRTPALLVTGGAGFIGSHFVRSLLAGAYPRWAGASVTVLDKLGYCGNLENLAPVAGHPGFRFVRGEGGGHGPARPGRTRPRSRGALRRRVPCGPVHRRGGGRSP